MTNAATGRRIAITGHWIKTIEDVDRGTVITFADSFSVVVKESFTEVLAEFTPGTA